MDFPTRTAQAKMNQSSFLCSRPSDLPCLALAQDEFQPGTLDQQQVLRHTLQTTTLSNRLLLGTFAPIATVARHAVSALVSLVSLHASTFAASHGCMPSR